MMDVSKWVVSIDLAVVYHTGVLVSAQARIPREGLVGKVTDLVWPETLVHSGRIQSLAHR